MESSSEKTKDKEDLDSPLVKVAETASNSDRDPPLYRDSPLEEVSFAITELVGDLDTHALNLEEVKKDIGKEIRALDRPSIAFKLTDLQTLVHRVLIKVRSYTRTCRDVTDFVCNFEEEEELQTIEEMLYFLNEMKSFSSPMKEELSAITKAIEAATTAVKELKDANEAAAQGSGDPLPPSAPSAATSTHQIQPTHAPLDTAVTDNSSQPRASPTYQQTRQASRTDQQTQQSTFQRLRSMFFGHNSSEQERQRAQKAILDQCAKHLKELAVEVERINKEAVDKYSRNIIASLEQYESANDTEELSAWIGEIRKVCAPSTSV